MAFVPVVSAALTAVNFDRRGGRLVIQFGEKFYAYEGVPDEVVLDFMFADSIGSEFAKLVKKGGFAFRQITAEAAGR